MYITSHYVLHGKHLILSEVKTWQMCYLKMVTFAGAHYIANLPNSVGRKWKKSREGPTIYTFGVKLSTPCSIHPLGLFQILWLKRTNGNILYNQ
jgi:hypothetical protein